MSNQFDRKYTLTIVPPEGAARTIKELALSFDIKKTLYGYPNLATLKLTNPSLLTLNALRRKYTQIILNVGYGDDLRLAFKGDIRNVTQSKTSTDRVVTIYAGDGSRAFSNSIFNKTFEAGVPAKQIVQEVIGTFTGLVSGDLSGVPNVADHPDGLSLSGQSSRVLDDLAREYQSDWSIQDGVVNVLPADKTLSGQDVTVISARSGMIGSPTVTERGANVTTLLNTQLVPGALISIKAVGSDVQLGNLFFRRENVTTNATGFYKVVTVDLKGNSRKGEWFSSVEGIRI